MIVVHCPLKQDFIIEVLTLSRDESISFAFIRKEGIRLFFQVDTQDIEEAIAQAKAKIRSTEIGSILFFQVTAHT